MSTALIALAAVVAALALIIGSIRLSMWLTHRKSSAELKRRVPDGSSSNDGGYMFSDHGVGGGD